MPVKSTAPSVEHCQKTALHAPVVFLEKFERLSRGFEQHVCCDPVVRLEEIMKFVRNRKNDVEMRAIRQALTDFL